MSAKKRDTGLQAYATRNGESAYLAEKPGYEAKGRRTGHCCRSRNGPGASEEPTEDETWKR